MENTVTQSTSSKTGKYLALAVLLLVLLCSLYFTVPNGEDWHDVYRPAARAVLEGKSPFSVGTYYAAPWAAWLLIPLAVLPDVIGRMALFLISLAAYTFIAYRLGARPLSVAIFLGSSVVVGCLLEGNIEWLALLGAVLPPPIGLIFLAIKPQVGMGLALYWFITIWCEQGFRKVVLTFMPVSIILILSFLFYGLWPLRFSQGIIALDTANSSLLPYGGALLGIVFLIVALRNRDSKAALAAGPLFSPYVLLFTWAAMLVYLLPKPKLLIIPVVVLWIPFILRLWGY